MAILTFLKTVDNMPYLMPDVMVQELAEHAQFRLMKNQSWHARHHGGYTKDFSERDPFTYQSTIYGIEPDFSSPGVRHGTVNAVDITSSTTVFDGFVIVGICS